MAVHRAVHIFAEFLGMRLHPPGGRGEAEAEDGIGVGVGGKQRFDVLIQDGEIHRAVLSPISCQFPEHPVNSEAAGHGVLNGDCAVAEPAVAEDKRRDDLAIEFDARVVQVVVEAGGHRLRSDFRIVGRRDLRRLGKFLQNREGVPGRNGRSPKGEGRMPLGGVGLVVRRLGARHFLQCGLPLRRGRDVGRGATVAVVEAQFGEEGSRCGTVEGVDEDAVAPLVQDAPNVADLRLGPVAVLGDLRAIDVEGEGVVAGGLEQCLNEFRRFAIQVKVVEEIGRLLHLRGLDWPNPFAAPLKTWPQGFQAGTVEARALPFGRGVKAHAQFATIPLRLGDIFRLQTAIGGGFQRQFRAEPILRIPETCGDYGHKTLWGIVYGEAIAEVLSNVVHLGGDQEFAWGLGGGHKARWLGGNNGPVAGIVQNCPVERSAMLIEECTGTIGEGVFGATQCHGEDSQLFALPVAVDQQA